MAITAFGFLIVLVATPACIRSWLFSSSETSYHTTTTTTTTYNIKVEPGATLNLYTNTGGGLLGRELAKGGKDIQRKALPRCIRTCDTSLKEICTFACTKLCIPMVYDLGSEVNMETKAVPRDFKLFNTNGDDFIEMSEMAAATKVPMMCAVEPFQIADLDGNDKLDIYEFDAASWNFEADKVVEAAEKKLEG